MTDKELWQRWEYHAKGMMTIPKFSKFWNATKQFHTRDFVNLWMPYNLQFLISFTLSPLSSKDFI